MMGRQDRDQRQLFYEFSLDEMIPTDHLLLVGYCYGIRHGHCILLTAGSASSISTIRFRTIRRSR
jgi:hypothetical protein